MSAAAVIIDALVHDDAASDDAPVARQRQHRIAERCLRVAGIVRTQIAQIADVTHFAVAGSMIHLAKEER